MTPPTLLHIRYYDQHLHPAQFRGFRGAVIRVLNFVRYLLEIVVERLVLGAGLRKMAEDLPVTRAAKQSVVATFWREVREERQIAAGALDPANPPSVQPRALRYASGRRVTMHVEGTEGGVETAGPVRPRPLDEMASRYGAGPRQRRYAITGQRPVMEDAFEAMTTADVSAATPAKE